MTDKSFDSIEEMFEDMGKEWKKEHPFFYWIDHTLFKRTDGVCGEAPHSFLSHPWIFFKWFYDRVKWAWQRVFIGYDERVIWSVDFYLSKMIPVWLEKLKTDKHGVPSSMFEDSDWDFENSVLLDGSMERATARYNEILNEIIEGFKLYENLDWKNPEDNDYDWMSQKFENGFDLFREYFGTFWD